ncbi:MAG: hypothetical protein DRJ42_08895 [Deltaproteobacteria bacterium]|nr:MAG: hypothetical protein DRJ42_08895 [Deltaproteobacteria bacterium]
MTFVHAIWDVMVELSQWLLLGAAVAGVLHAALPADFVHRTLRGRWGTLKAVLLGVPLPLCSCGVIPAGLGLKKDGASNGAVVGFLISTPQTGVDSILVSASFLGWPFALFKVASAFALGLAGGAVTDLVDPGDDPPPLASTSSARPSWRDGLDHAIDMIRNIWRWLVFGVLVSAALTTLVPPDAFVGLAAYGGAVAMVAMLAVSVPLYVCATASVPIAAALVAGGFPPGAALVFLMAGPATNVATIGAVKRAFGVKTLGVYLATIIVGSLGLGWAFDFVLVGELGVAAADGAHHAPGVIALGATAVLCLLFAFFAWEELSARIRRAVSSRSAAGPSVDLDVGGLTCDGCVRKLEKKLAEVEGVEGVEVVREPHGHAAVRGNVSTEAVREAVREAGFEPS